MAKVMMVFDFDRTIIDCDSDNWVVEQLGVNEVFTELLPTLPWNCLMDRMMMELHSRGKTIQDIAVCLKQIPLHPRIISAIKSAYASGCDLRIVSDSNTFFIKTVLEHYGLTSCFSEIITNPSYVDAEGRLRILQYHDLKSPHGCTICPPNMCKGLVMERIRNSVSADVENLFIYVGDGTPDYCAASRLEGKDIVLPRKHFPFWELIFNDPMFIRASIREWNDGEELGTLLLNLIDTIFTDSHNSVRPDLLLQVDCKSRILSVPDACNKKTLQVPH